MRQFASVQLLKKQNATPIKLEKDFIGMSLFPMKFARQRPFRFLKKRGRRNNDRVKTRVSSFFSSLVL